MIIGESIKELLNKPFWVLALASGVLLVAAPEIQKTKDGWGVHSANTPVLSAVGILLILGAFASFAYVLRAQGSREPDDGLDFASVVEVDGLYSTRVGDCELRVTLGRIQDQPQRAGMAIVLPCNEYFDDECVADSRSALGAYVNSVFEGQVSAFCELVRTECSRQLVAAALQQKTDRDSAVSYGTGQCLLLTTPLGRPTPVALVATTTQRAGQGLTGQIAYLFAGMQTLVARLADCRIEEVVMPVMGAGHGRIGTARAFVGLLLAVAEAIGTIGGHRLKRVTVVVYRADHASQPTVAPTVIKRALALVTA